MESNKLIIGDLLSQALTAELLSLPRDSVVNVVSQIKTMSRSIDRFWRLDFLMSAISDHGWIPGPGFGLTIDSLFIRNFHRRLTALITMAHHSGWFECTWNDLRDAMIDLVCERADQLSGSAKCLIGVGNCYDLLADIKTNYGDLNIREFLFRNEHLISFYMVLVNNTVEAIATE